MNIKKGSVVRYRIQAGDDHPFRPGTLLSGIVIGKYKNSVDVKWSYGLTEYGIPIEYFENPAIRRMRTKNTVQGNQSSEEKKAYAELTKPGSGGELIYADYTVSQWKIISKGLRRLRDKGIVSSYKGAAHDYKGLPILATIWKLK